MDFQSARWTALTMALCPIVFALSPIEGVGMMTSSDFSRHFVIHPKIIHGREKRQISTTAEKNGYHAEKIVFNYYIDNNLYVIDLKLNKDLIPKNAFIEYQSDGKSVTTEITEKEIDLCQYIGKIRGIEESSVALSTCNGINGVIYYGNCTHYIQSGKDESLNAPHLLYKHDDLILNHTCGNENLYDVKFLEMQKKRYKRSNQFTLREPHNSDKYSRYVELMLVVDNMSYRKMGSNLAKVYSHCQQLANIMNMIYTPLNIFIALVGIKIWTEHDEIVMSQNADNVLDNFLIYRKEKLCKTHPNDNAQLLTQQKFENSVVGKATIGSMCTNDGSGGVVYDNINVIGLVAIIAAHELGHNIGINHDIDDCGCPENKCIMSTTSDIQGSLKWSTCSLNYLTEALEQGMDYCLKNKPESLFKIPICGNGFVEEDEQCDCGLSKSCEGNKCCDPSTCKFYPNVTCATGECCDKNTCQILPGGTTCRGAEYECDLTEYCDGVSEYCPKDIYKIDGTSCANGDSFCYQGGCRTRTDECRLLWGPSSENGHDKCYDSNIDGNRKGNCGYNTDTKTYLKCEEQDKLCGLLQCQKIYNNLKFGMNAYAIIMDHYKTYYDGSQINCRTVLVNVGSDQADIGLVPNGAKCGEKEMCLNQKCVPINKIKNNVRSNDCYLNCSGNGICNSLGHCHCNEGFRPPFCNVTGSGGSIDSGPLMQNNWKYSEISMYLAVSVAFIFAIIILVTIFKYQNKRNNSSSCCTVNVNCSSCFLFSDNKKSKSIISNEITKCEMSTTSSELKKKIEKPVIVKGALISTTNENVQNNVALYKSGEVNIKQNSLTCKKLEKQNCASTSNTNVVSANQSTMQADISRELNEMILNSRNVKKILLKYENNPK